MGLDWGNQEVKFARELCFAVPSLFVSVSLRCEIVVMFSSLSYKPALSIAILVFQMIANLDPVVLDHVCSNNVLSLPKVHKSGTNQ